MEAAVNEQAEDAAAAVLLRGLAEDQLRRGRGFRGSQRRAGERTGEEVGTARRGPSVSGAGTAAGGRADGGTGNWAGAESSEGV